METILLYLTNSINSLGLGSYMPIVATKFGISNLAALIVTASSLAVPVVTVISTVIYFKDEIRSVFNNIFNNLVGKSKLPVESISNISPHLTQNNSAYQAPVVPKPKVKKVVKFDSEPQIRIVPVKDDSSKITPVSIIKGIFYNNSQSTKQQNFREYEGSHDHHSKLSSGRNEGKKILLKIPVTPKDKENPDQAKFKYQWIAKTQDNAESINEVISADAFRMFVGNDLAPKYRLVKDDRGRIWTVTKILENFKQARDILEKPLIENQEDRTKIIEDIEIEIEPALDNYKKYKTAYIKAGTCNEDHKSRYISKLNVSEEKDKAAYDYAIEAYRYIRVNVDYKKAIEGRKYINYIKNYINLISNTENFNHIIAISLLFGKDDMHSGNWGIIEKENKKYVSMVDHGQALKSGFSMYDMMYSYRHRKEIIVTKEFAEACLIIAQDFDGKKEQVKSALRIGIERAKEFYAQHEIKDLDEYMKILESNKKNLIQLSYQIQVEIAIEKGDIKDFKEYLSKMDPTFLVLFQNADPIRGFNALSKQNYRDGFIDRDGLSNFILLIKSRLENDCDKKVFIYDYGQEDYIRCKDYESRMIQKDKEIEKELLNVYFEVARAKNPNQAKINDERNKSNSVLNIGI